MPATRKKADSKVQAKLGFTSISKDSIQAQELSPSVRSRASAVTYHSPKKGNGLKSTAVPTRHTIETRSRVTQQKLQLDSGSSRRSSRLAQRDDTNDREDLVYVSQRRSSPGLSDRLPSSSKYVQRSSPEGEESETELTLPQSRRSRNESSSKPPRSSPPITIIQEDEDDDDSIIALPHTGTRRRPQILNEDEVDDDDDLALPSIGRSDNLLLDSDEGDEIVQLISSRGNRRSNRPTGLSKHSAEDEEEEEPILPSSKRNPLRSKIMASDQENDEEEDPIMSERIQAKSEGNTINNSSSPAKRRRLQHGSNPKKQTREEQDEEVLEDAEDLQDTSTINEGLRSISKLNEKKLLRQRELSKLLARRNKTLPSQSLSPSPSQSQSPTPYNDTYSDLDSSRADSLINDSDSHSESNSTIPPPTSAPPTIRTAITNTIHHILSLKLQLPTTKKPSNPQQQQQPSPASYSTLTARLESLLNASTSSTWRPLFLASLHARPYITYPALHIPTLANCTACGRRDRPATVAIRFEGRCYNEDTLVQITGAPITTTTTTTTTSAVIAAAADTQNSDSDSDSGGSSDSEEGEEQEEEEEEEKKLEIWRKYGGYVSAEHVWWVGSECARNAGRAHEARHWVWWLAEDVQRVLAEMDVEIHSHSRLTHADTHDGDDDDDDDDKEVNGNSADRVHAVLQQMEELGYLRELQDGLLGRFEMLDDDDDDDDDYY